MNSNHRGIDRQRRTLVLGGAALAGAAMSGCCTVPAPQLPAGCAPDVAPFLGGPEVAAAWRRSERYFDAHTHFFNAADVPVRGFLAKSVAHSIEDPTVRDLMIALAPIAEWVGKGFAPSVTTEMQSLRSRCDAGSKSTRAALARTVDLDQEIEDRSRNAAEELFKEIGKRDRRIEDLVNREFPAATSAGVRAPEAGTAPAFSQAFIEQAFRNGAGQSPKITGVEPPLIGPDAKARQIRQAQIQNLFQFVGYMLSPRHHNLRSYIKKFANGSPATPLSGCFAAMVDFNYWLGRPSLASHMRDQVLIHEQLSLLSGGFMLPIVGYNPWVDIKESDASLATVKWAVLEHGCVGVKIYPPMGFYPYGNDGNPLAGSTEQRPDLRRLDQQLARLYALCEELDVPVMAHASESLGRDSAHDKLPGVKGWHAVNDQLKNLKTLYVNAGHFGGATNRELGDAEWTDDFAALMGSAERLKVYADLGFWDELTRSQAARDRLQRALKKTVGADQAVADRTMYGSDWLMLSQSPGWESYADGVASVLRNFDPTGSIAKRVLGRNALDCYGLAEGSGRGNLRRTRDRAADGRAPLPGWMLPREPAGESVGNAL